MATEDIRLDGQGDLRDEPEGLLEQEHPGGGRFNRLILITFAVVAIVSGVVVALGVESSGIGQSALQKPADDPGASARNNGEIADLAAHGGKRTRSTDFRTASSGRRDRASAHPTGTAATAQPLRAVGGREVHEGA